MATLTCPYCYHEQARTGLLFVCDGAGSPGRPGCQPVRDAERERHTGFNGTAMPVFPAALTADRGRRGQCTVCGCWSGRRACLNCHTPLPGSLVNRPGPLIGMVGDTWAGKTVFLTVLNKELRDTIGARFRADVGLVGDEQAGMSSIQEWLRIYERALYKDGKLPGRTQRPPGAVRVPLVIEWRHPRRNILGRTSHPASILSFCDAAGEDRRQADRQRYLRAADGLIVLLDAYQLPGVRSKVPLPADASQEAPLVDTVLSGITQVIRDGGQHREKITTPVAVVIAKLDVIEPLLPESHFLRRARPSEEPGYDERFGTEMDTYVRSLLNEHGADRIVHHMEAHYKNYRFFAASALGLPPDNEKKQVNERGVRPRHVAEPLLWLMSLNGIIKQVGGG